MALHKCIVRLAPAAAFMVWASIAAAQDTPNAAAPATVQPSAVDSDSDVANRVKAALHADTHVYDKHVEVAVKHGDVVLNGFVGNDWDLRSVVRIATEAAGGRKVVDNLKIKEGGN
jgi:osmotically-inducible protein OsmY